MKRLVPFLLLVASVAAQPGMPTPPKELARLDPMMGRWEGEGVFFSEPGGQALPWTSVSHVRKVYNGHFVRADDTIMLGPDGAVGTLGFMAFHQWDPVAQRIVITTIGNMGQLDRAEMRWIDDKTIVTTGHGWEEGRRTMERWITKIVADGKQEVRGEKAVDGSPFFLHVKGTLERKEGAPPALDKVGSFMAVPSEHIEKLARMCGEYELKGAWRMASGAKMMPWEGTERIESIFGGLVVRMTSKGSEGYEGIGAFVWDQSKGCFRSFHCGSMGFAHVSDHWLMNDEHMVSNTSMLFMGQPMMMRNVVTLDGQGRPVSAKGHSIGGVDAPFESMAATYERKAATSRESKGN